MKKTHVNVIVKIEYKARKSLDRIVENMDYHFDSPPSEFNADIMDTEIISCEKTASGCGRVIVDVLIHHDDDNLDEVLSEMDYSFDHPDIVDTEIVDWTIKDSQ